VDVSKARRRFREVVELPRWGWLRGGDGGFEVESIDRK
jgi:hypothetical protein